MKNLLHMLLLMILSGSLFAQTSTAPAGTGTAVDPYQIATLNNFYWLTINPSAWAADKYCIQTADIDASGTNTWNAGAGISSIGYTGAYFYGSYNGMGHTITGLYINRPATNEIALFGQIQTSGIVSNLGLISVNFTGAGFTAGFVGFNQGTVQKCYVTGSVTGSGASGNWVGGFVGSNHIGGFINQCYSSATVNAYQVVGGFAGENWSSGTISNCYARGTVTGYSYVGGFVGHNNGTSSITYSYSTGLVSAPFNKGGFSALGTATCTACFWDNQISGIVTSVQGSGKTTAEMKTSTTFTGAAWDFAGETSNGSNNYWNINGSSNNGYPVLEYFYTLPVRSLELKAQTVSNTVQLSWLVSNELNVKEYNIQYSTNGTDFRSVGAIASKGSGENTYSFTDNQLVNGVVWYRISESDYNGRVFYSNVIRIQGKSQSFVSLYPNPAQNYLMVTVDDKDLGNYVMITNESGACLYKTKITARVFSIGLEGFSSGIYFIKVGAAAAIKFIKSEY